MAPNAVVACPEGCNVFFLGVPACSCGAFTKCDREAACSTITVSNQTESLCLGKCVANGRARVAHGSSVGNNMLPVDGMGGVTET